MENNSYIWYDGRLVKNDEAKTHILTHSLHYGCAFFEGIRSYHDDNCSYVFRLDDHIKRLLKSAEIAGLETPFDANAISQACIDVLKANELSEAYIRPLLFIGHGTLGVNPAQNPVQVAIAAWKWGNYLGKEALENGIHAQISTYNRFHPNTALLHTKMTGGYMTNVLAKREALKNGYQEAILLDTEGFVAEGSGENIFVVFDNKLYTPPRMRILPGITRDTVMQLAKELKLDVVEYRFARDFLYLADEVFFTGTAAEVTPVASIDSKKIGDGKRGPITQQLQELYFKCVRGQLEKYQHFLTSYSNE